MELGYEKYLPIGSICKLKDGEALIMITGYLGAIQEEAIKVYDYIGVLYPIGSVSEDVTIAFNHNQIEQVVFKGYENDTYRELLNDIRGISKESIIQNIVEEQGNSNNLVQNEAVNTVDNLLNSSEQEIYVKPQ